MDLERIRALIALAEENKLVELEVREGDLTIRFRRAEAVPAPPVGIAALISASSPGAGPQAPAAAAPATHGFVVKAPMEGTFFRAPAPGERPFVEVGSKVDDASVIGIIESMKMMNPVECGRGGTVGVILVADNQRVQIDQPLLTIV